MTKVLKVIGTLCWIHNSLLIGYWYIINMYKSGWGMLNPFVYWITLLTVVQAPIFWIVVVIGLLCGFLIHKKEESDNDTQYKEFLDTKK